MSDPVEVDQTAQIDLTADELRANPSESICRAIRHADEAVTACQQSFPRGHRARDAMDDAIVLLHAARRYAEV